MIVLWMIYSKFTYKSDKNWFKYKVSAQKSQEPSLIQPKAQYWVDELLIEWIIWWKDDKNAIWMHIQSKNIANSVNLKM